MRTSAWALIRQDSLFLIQVQLRLQQVVGAAPEKREDLLRELEQFAFRGIPNLASPRIPKQTEVEDEARRFYRKLYSCHDNIITIDTIEEFLGPASASCPKLTPTETQSMEGELTMQELQKYLKKVRNNVSPGSSGYSGEFFKFFWRDLKKFFLCSANYSFETGSLAVS